jgi:hypothetical protein
MLSIKNLTTKGLDMKIGLVASNIVDYRATQVDTGVGGSVCSCAITLKVV